MRSRLRRRPQVIIASAAAPDWQIVYAVRVTVAKTGALIGYIGHRIVEFRGNNNRQVVLEEIQKHCLTPGRDIYHHAAIEFVQNSSGPNTIGDIKYAYYICRDIISPEQKFERPNATDRERRQQQEQLKQYLEREKIDKSVAHIGALKFRRKHAARRIIKQLPLIRRFAYDVVRIQLIWQQPWTVQLLSN